MHAWHTTRAGDGRRVLLPGEGQIRRAIRTKIRVAGPDLLLFCLAGDHDHDVTGHESKRRTVAGNRVRALSLALRRITDVPLEPARVRPVKSQSHMRSLLRYVWQQPKTHGLPVNPVLWSGSSFLDTIGARWIEGWRPRLRAMLPTLTMKEVLATLDLPPDPFVPLDPATLRRVGAERIVSATSAALAASPGLETNRPCDAQARAAAARACQFARIHVDDLASALGTTTRTARRLAEKPVPGEAVDAFRKRLGLELFLERAAWAAAGVAIADRLG